MLSDINVVKRDGSLKKLDLEKIHQVIQWAKRDLDVSISAVEMKAHLQLVDGIKTTDIHEALTKSAADLISEETPDYQYLAANLNILNIRKKAFDNFDVPEFKPHLESLVEKGVYHPDLIENFSDAELGRLGGHIDNERDLTFSYAATVQLAGKYLAQDRVNKKLYESPQLMYMCIAMTLFINSEDRINKICSFYDALSTFKISLPTPIMAGVRTLIKQYSSCVLVETGDSLDSINATTSVITKYISNKAGLGINAGAIRAEGSPISNGAVHTGLIPFYKLFQAGVKSCSQG